jgi:DNA replication protein DnaC
MQAELSSNKKYLVLRKKWQTLACDIGRRQAYEELVTEAEINECKKLEAEVTALETKLLPHSPKTPEIEFGDKTNKNLAGNLENFCAKFPDTKFKNIFLFGATGTGKTYAVKIAAEKIKQKGCSVHFTTTYNLIKRMRENAFGANDITKDFFTSQLLIIDDLGTEPDHKNSDEYLYTVLAERYENDKSFIITTNLTPDQIMSRYDARIAGRIFDKNKTFSMEVIGADLRI